MHGVLVLDSRVVDEEEVEPLVKEEACYGLWDMYFYPFQADVGAISAPCHCACREFENVQELRRVELYLRFFSGEIHGICNR